MTSIEPDGESAGWMMLTLGIRKETAMTTIEAIELLVQVADRLESDGRTDDLKDVESVIYHLQYGDDE